MWWWQLCLLCCYFSLNANIFHVYLISEHVNNCTVSLNRVLFFFVIQEHEAQGLPLQCWILRNVTSGAITWLRCLPSLCLDSFLFLPLRQCAEIAILELVSSEYTLVLANTHTYYDLVSVCCSIVFLMTYTLWLYYCLLS